MVNVWLWLGQGWGPQPPATSAVPALGPSAWRLSPRAVPWLPTLRTPRNTEAREPCWPQGALWAEVGFHGEEPTPALPWALLAVPLVLPSKPALHPGLGAPGVGWACRADPGQASRELQPPAFLDTMGFRALRRGTGTTWDHSASREGRPGIRLGPGTGNGGVQSPVSGHRAGWRRPVPPSPGLLQCKTPASVAGPVSTARTPALAQGQVGP